MRGAKVTAGPEPATTTGLRVTEMSASQSSGPPSIGPPSPSHGTASVQCTLTASCK